ncbi:MAG: hypothetical protein V3T65_06955 [Acidobacteriota bacterium]
MKWYEDHDNLVLLTRYLAAMDDSSTEIAYAVEKPWKFEKEFKAAQEWAAQE